MHIHMVVAKSVHRGSHDYFVNSLEVVPATLRRGRKLVRSASRLTRAWARQVDLRKGFP